MSDNTEILFWKVIKNKFLFYNIISFTNIRFRTIKYEVFNDISQIINSNNLSLLIEKLNHGEINFKNYNNFDCIFKKIKNINEENIKIYKKLIPHYSMVDFHKLLECSIENDCLVGFLVLINENSTFNETNNIIYNNNNNNKINYYYNNCIMVKNNYQFYFDEALKNNSINILTYLIENDENNNFPCSIEWKALLLSKKIHKSIIIKMLSKIPRLISLIRREDLSFFKGSIFPEDVLNIDLEILIGLCIIIINIPFLKNIKSSSSSSSPTISTMEEINEIKNEYSEEDLKSNIINLEYDDLDLKKLIKFYYDSLEFDIDYNPFRFLKFDDDGESNEEINSHANQIRYKIITAYRDSPSVPSLEHCNSRLLEMVVNDIGALPIFETQLLYPQILFRFMKSSNVSKSRYKTFISKLFLKNLLNPIVLLFLLIEYDDIELIEFLISLSTNSSFNTSVDSNSNSNSTNFFKDNYIKRVSNELNNKENFDIKRYIRSNEMLEFCFTNFNEIILHSKFINNLTTWVKMDRIDLIENFNQLIKNQLNDKYSIENDLILPTFINIGYSKNATSIPKGYGLISYAYLIKKLKETRKNFNISNYLDEKLLLKSLLLKVNSNINLDYQLECIKLIIENTTEQYNPLSIMAQTYTESNNKIENDLFILKVSYINKQFLYWLFTNRKSADIDTSRCIFSTCKDKVPIYSQLSLISALYLSNQIDQFLIEFENHLINESYFQLDIIFEIIGKNSDYKLLGKLLDTFNNFETKTQPLPKTFNQEKKRLLSLCFFKASVDGNKIIFKFLLENYDNILFPKNSKLPEESFLETDESFQRYVAKAVEKENHQLFQFFFQNLGYQSIISELDYSSNLFYEIHENYNHLSK
ncbi:hypothetical protein ACTFIY_008711 [Dictyostelium cf. discoideum]